MRLWGFGISEQAAAERQLIYQALGIRGRQRGLGKPLGLHPAGGNPLLCSGTRTARSIHLRGGKKYGASKNIITISY